MGEDGYKRATARIPEELHEQAKQNARHGQITREIQNVFEALANGEEYDPDVETKKKEDVYETLEKEERPGDWQKRRRRVFNRDNWMCRNCEARGGIDGHETLACHHIVPVHAGGNHYLSNLVTLCKDCHNKAHNSY
jgi:hypothetical protein